VLLALLAAAGVSLFVAESFVPLPLPFLKLGFANVSTLLALLAFGFPAALGVAFVRILAGALLTGTLFGPGFLLSLAGGLSATCVMGGAKAVTGRMFGPVGLSLLGSAAHVTAQLLVVAELFTGSAVVLSLLPLLLGSAFAGGLVVGWLAARALPLLGIERGVA
jgi:heptaprenyl diphosphate synthase